MRPSWGALAVMLLACVLGITIPIRSADSFSFTPIDVPGATWTKAYGINGAGQIVGTFWAGACEFRSFLRATTGTFTRLDHPQHRPPECLTPRHATATDAYGINDAGQIVGNFWNGWEQKRHGYLRTAAGAFITIDVPGATQTDPHGINGAGQIVGTFEDADGKWHGFLRTATGAFTTIDVPGATETRASGINRGGQIVGDFTDAGRKSHGFLRTAAGAFTTIDVPGATTTGASGINRGGQIVGTFSEMDGTHHKYHGFLRAADGTFTRVDPPGATWTEAKGINDAGQIVGTFTDAAFGPRGRALPPPWHGFVTAR